MLPPPSRSDLTSVPVSAMPASTRSSDVEVVAGLAVLGDQLAPCAHGLILRGDGLGFGRRLLEAGQPLRGDEQPAATISSTAQTANPASSPRAALSTPASGNSHSIWIEKQPSAIDIEVARNSERVLC